ncbi:hypothetical protein [Streptomyces sp. 769]|uniref:hypothetical protein n=1 Tax=Streptomyces sp. 769 TaxID=1262452 RepID=UPI000580AF55|nr:hypothetical protein [Streptomyces sp. 769]AJC53974.1 hypothetical protein GZL_01374 [Streptomyces sp. 769]
MSKGLSKPYGRSVKARGRDFENHVKDALVEVGIPAERNGSKYGSKDRGDLDTKWASLVVQCKNTRTQAVLNTMDAAQEQANNAGVTDHCSVFRYRRGDDFGPHRQNVWCFPEEFAKRLLLAYYGER